MPQASTKVDPRSFSKKLTVKSPMDQIKKKKKKNICRPADVGDKEIRRSKRSQKKILLIYMASIRDIISLDSSLRRPPNRTDTKPIATTSVHVTFSSFCAKFD